MPSADAERWAYAGAPILRPPVMVFACLVLPQARLLARPGIWRRDAVLERSGPPSLCCEWGLVRQQCDRQADCACGKPVHPWSHVSDPHQHGCPCLSHLPRRLACGCGTHLSSHYLPTRVPTWPLASQALWCALLSCHASLTQMCVHACIPACLPAVMSAARPSTQ